MTTVPAFLQNVLRSDASLHPTSNARIWTTLPPAETGSSYDKIASGYDAIVGNPVYNRLVWGAWPSRYADAAKTVLSQAATEGPILDCGCGSLVFTHHAYRMFRGDLVLFDRSSGMLARGATRWPEGTFVQGDAFHPPFQDGSFAAVMCWGVFHLFGTHSPLLDKLRQLVQPKGIVALSSLVLANRRIGDRMLSFLHRSGEITTPQTAAEVTDAFAQRFDPIHSQQCGNMLTLFGKSKK